MNKELILTEDGSHTLYLPNIDECYHSSHGAIQESKHIFIEAGLKQCAKTEITILEVGFGTGLNALLASIWAEKSGTKVKYITLEKFPLELESSLALNYATILEENTKYFTNIHSAAWNNWKRIHSNFEILKIEADFCHYQHDTNYDIVFFDAFSPDKQAEMWSLEQFEKIYNHCNQNAIMTTYCAKGIVRRTLQKAGFVVERLAGPPGKREILRARKE
jgi:tRNA U34 5-methylaminomethyl-2-thiouridine-forming methyltransferase MnmC